MKFEMTKKGKIVAREVRSDNRTNAVDQVAELLVDKLSAIGDVSRVDYQDPKGFTTKVYSELEETEDYPIAQDLYKVSSKREPSSSMHTVYVKPLTVDATFYIKKALF